MTPSAPAQTAAAPVPSDAFDIRRVSGALGAEVRGIDLDDLSDAQFDRIHELLLEHLVLFFPDQERLTPEGHIAFGRRFGEVEVHPFLPKLEGHPEITVIQPDKGGKADEWHIDVSFSPSPPIASILHLIDTPPPAATPCGATSTGRTRRSPSRSRRCSKGSPPSTS
ncbi:TauD/TfdA family dioxygenase [Streptomyces sp. AD16]|nr:TauD/TfdA family dioxygenase [Streptomyces sp. AD16]